MTAEVSAGGVVINRDGDILVVNQDGSVWSLPKGHVNPGETMRAAAEREIKEESGVSSLRYIKGLGSYQRYQVGKGGVGEHRDRLKTIRLFLYTTDQYELAPEDPRNPEARWVAPEEVAAVLTVAKDKAYFAGILPDVLQFLAQSK
jgi:ADP-ribose pyrophosphatase YjhB (NUDIX family)